TQSTARVAPRRVGHMASVSPVMALRVASQMEDGALGGIQERVPDDDLPLDAHSQYLRDVHRVSPLRDGEETHLLRAIQAGDGAARNRLVVALQPWVMALARRYAAGSTTLSLLDYVQEGNVGLLEALARHDGRADQTPFRTWAYWWVRGAMR